MTATERRPRTRAKILVVDDDPDARLVLTVILDAAGYQVITAEDAYDAILKLYETRPDVLLLDLMLPEKDGWDVIRAIRSDPEIRDLPIVAMSAKFGLLNARGHGTQGYVRKPFDTPAMLDTLDRVLREEMSATGC